jgi:hypothetical protein
MKPHANPGDEYFHHRLEITPEQERDIRANLPVLQGEFGERVMALMRKTSDELHALGVHHFFAAVGNNADGNGPHSLMLGSYTVSTAAQALADSAALAFGINEEDLANPGAALASAQGALSAMYRAAMQTVIDKACEEHPAFKTWYDDTLRKQQEAASGLLQKLFGLNPMHPGQEAGEENPDAQDRPTE